MTKILDSDLSSEQELNFENIEKNMKNPRGRIDTRRFFPKLPVSDLYRWHDARTIYEVFSFAKDDIVITPAEDGKFTVKNKQGNFRVLVGHGGRIIEKTYGIVLRNGKFVEFSNVKCGKYIEKDG